MPKGANEIELWATDRRGKETGHYDAQDYRIELDDNPEMDLNPD